MVQASKPDSLTEKRNGQGVGNVHRRKDVFPLVLGPMWELLHSICLPLLSLVPMNVVLGFGLFDPLHEEK